VHPCAGERPYGNGLRRKAKRSRPRIRKQREVRFEREQGKKCILALIKRHKETLREERKQKQDKSNNAKRSWK
jgi:hypothetical protein